MVIDRFRVDGVIRAFRKSCLPIQRRDVVDDVDGLGRAADRAGIAKVAGNEIDPGGGEIGGAVHVAHERADGVAARRERPREVTAGKPGGAGD